MGQTATTIKYESETTNDDSYDESEYEEDSYEDEEHDDEEEYEEDEDYSENPPQDEKSKAKIQIVNLLTLSTEELQSHLSNYALMTKHDIRNIALAQKEQNNDLVKNQEWYQNKINEPTANNTTTTTAEDLDVTMKSHTDVALDILNLSPVIKTLRFKLVPSKLSENSFWAAVFYALEYCSIDDLGASETFVSSKITPTKENTNSVKIVPNSSLTPSSDNDKTLMLLVKQKDDQLESLKKQLTQAKHDLSTLQKQLSQMTSSSATKKHQGKWIMSKESQEFLLLDEDIKRQLREGKNKRIQDVYEQMKFIMDSDEAKDSQGEWACCGSTKYSSVCQKC